MCMCVHESPSHTVISQVIVDLIKTNGTDESFGPIGLFVGTSLVLVQASRRTHRRHSSGEGAGSHFGSLESVPPRR